MSYLHVFFPNSFHSVASELVDSFGFPAYAFAEDFQILRHEWHPSGLLCWRVVARSASYRGF